MAYTTENFHTKKALKEAVAAGKRVQVYQPGPFGGPGCFYDGTHSVEGPHYPEPHRWYARVTVEKGIVTRVE